MALKKLSITNEQVNIIKELLSKKTKIKVIAVEIKVSRTTLWRNLSILKIKSNVKKKKVVKNGYFNWNNYKNNSVI